MLRLAVASLTAILLFSPTLAGAITWDFVPPIIPPATFVSESAGTSTIFVSAGVSLTVTGWQLTRASGSYTAAHVWRRNEGANDVGLGICNSNDGLTKCGKQGAGGRNEIDNKGTRFDVLRINLTDRTPLTLQQVRLSSVDGDDDDWQIFGSNTAFPNLSSLTPIVTGGPSGNANPVVNLSGTYTYLFFTTDPFRSVSDDASNYLVRELTTMHTPEPGTLLLLGSGLVGLAGAAWRRRR